MPDWHPIMAAVEDAPGFWRMVAQYGTTYGTVRLIRRASQLGYRADLIPRPGREAQLVGYFTNLRAACHAVHDAHLRVETSSPLPNGRHDIGGGYARG